MAAALVLSACGSTSSISERCEGGLGCPVPARDLSRYLNIVAGGAEPALPYVLGSTFRLAADARPYRLIGYDSHRACDSLLRSPNGRCVIYGTSQTGWPALDLLDRSTGTRVVFRAQACDPTEVHIRPSNGAWIPTQRNLVGAGARSHLRLGVVNGFASPTDIEARATRADHVQWQEPYKPAQASMLIAGSRAQPRAFSRADLHRYGERAGGARPDGLGCANEITRPGSTDDRRD